MRPLALALLLSLAVTTGAQDAGELVLKSGERLPVTDVVRTEGRVRFRTPEGQVRQVPEGEVTSPPLDTLPVLLRLRSGEAFAVRRLARAGDRVRFQTLRGEVRQVPGADVVSPSLASIPALPGTDTPPPPVPVPTPVPTPEPPALPVPFPAAPGPAPRGFTPEFAVVGSRWDILDALPDDRRQVRGETVDPYNQNVLKGDKPVAGDSVFFVLTASLDVLSEARRLPLPSGVSTERPGSFEFFGDGQQVFSTPRVIVSGELFKGQTAFRPKTWAVKVTAVANLNVLQTQERNAVAIDPREGTTRRRQDVSLEEAFVEVKLKDLSPKFDVLSARVGIQPFLSDFRGFVFADQNLAVRLFGNADANRWQYNVVAADLLEKETNSELNLFERRHHRVFIGNVFRQDFLTRGYTLQLSVHHSRDVASEEAHYDANGFLVRPAKIGTPRLHDVTTTYFGVAGDGHIGRVNVSNAFYWVRGQDDASSLAPRLSPAQDVSAFLGALELSVDQDWVRPRVSAFFASGDDDVEDGRAQGFDAIYDGVSFAGGPFSFWNRSAIPLTQTGVLLKAPSSLLPDLRSNKFEGQANHVNPGLLLLGVGLDLELTPKLRAVLNASYLRFHHTGVLETVLQQPGIRKDIGLDLGAGVLWRPLLNENLVVTAGITGLLPGGAMQDLFSSSCTVAGCGAGERTLLNGFLQMKVTY